MKIIESRTGRKDDHTQSVTEEPERLTMQRKIGDVLYLRKHCKFWGTRPEHRTVHKCWEAVQNTIQCYRVIYDETKKRYYPDIERLLLNDKTPGFLGSGGDDFNPGPETRLDHSEFLCNKVLLKYKGGRESFWHGHQKGAKEYPPPSL